MEKEFTGLMDQRKVLQEKILKLLQPLTDNFYFIHILIEILIEILTSLKYSYCLIFKVISMSLLNNKKTALQIDQIKKCIIENII
jgi:hypothetical protein